MGFLWIMHQVVIWVLNPGFLRSLTVFINNKNKLYLLYLIELIKVRLLR